MPPLDSVATPTIAPRLWSAFLPGRSGRPPARQQAAQATASDPHDGYRKQSFFGSLDGLRAASILAVVWHHTASALHPGGVGAQGNKGVTLFFVISGFLIVTLLLRAKARRGFFSLRRFWGRRFCRIFPVYYVVLGLYLAGVCWLDTEPAARTAFLGNLPAFATFTSNWFVNLDSSHVIFFFAWSLAAEEQFYLLWPWAERFLSGRGAVGLAVITLLVTQLAGWAWGPLAGTSLPLKIFTSVPAGILLGVILAHVLHSKAGFRAMWLVCGHWWSAPVFAVLAFGALRLIPVIGEDLGNVVAAIAMVPLVASCVVREDNGLAPFLRLRPIVWIGTVSYGMYLLHMIGVHLAHSIAAEFGFASPYLDFAAGGAIALAAASLSFVTLERYFLRKKEQWFAGEGTAPAPTGWARLPVFGSLFS